jgi:hypothetical protein
MRLNTVGISKWSFKPYEVKDSGKLSSEQRNDVTTSRLSATCKICHTLSVDILKLAV